MPPHVDLVIDFRATALPNPKNKNKNKTREDAKRAERQYINLLETLKHSGLSAVGRRGETQGHVLVFVTCPMEVLNRLARRERHSDFLYGLPAATATVATMDAENAPLAPSDRLRIIYSYVTSTLPDGGLGIIPRSEDWDLVDSIMLLHDHEFNSSWIHSWTSRNVSSTKMTEVRAQLGDSVALYFSFLDAYTRALVFPAALGIIFFFFGTPYSPVYSSLLLLWAVIFVEWWRVTERRISMRNGTSGSFRVEKRRANYVEGFSWWKRDLRVAASLPVILLFVGVLASMLTGIFMFEAFVTQLYNGPGHKYISLAPTVIFAALVPQILGVYHKISVAFTRWENHRHQSTYNFSLTIKTFTLSAVVAYLGLALSAFVYVPFGESLMRLIQIKLFHAPPCPAITETMDALNTTIVNATGGTQNFRGGDNVKGIWETDLSNARSRLNPTRLRDQMFAFTVTNQVVNTFVEVGLPFILRRIASFRNGKHSGGKKKRVGFEGESGVKGEEKNISGGDVPRAGESKEEREFLESVRKQAALPEFDLFGDYSEMVTQFGYVSLWSTIWPLAPVMALLNNHLELRSDAFKMTVHNRRAIPVRTDTIGPWLDCLSFLTWLSALTNSALVYLFRPQGNTLRETRLDTNHTRFFSGTASTATLASPSEPSVGDHKLDLGAGAAGAGTRELLVSAVLIAFAASHGYMLLRLVVRSTIERALWTGSKEVADKEKGDREMKESYLRALPSGSGGVQGAVGVNKAGDEEVEKAFWEWDEGVEEIQRLVKED